MDGLKGGRALLRQRAEQRVAAAAAEQRKRGASDDALRLATGRYQANGVIRMWVAFLIHLHQ